MTSLKALNLSKADLFGIIDKEGKGTLTQRDFMDFMNTRSIDQLRDSDVELFIDKFFSGGKTKMDLRTFNRIFDKYEASIDHIENPYDLNAGKRMRSKVEDKVIVKKQEIFKSIHRELVDKKVTLYEFFNHIDRDSSDAIDCEEFKNMFKTMMQLDLSDIMLNEIFRSIDLDNNGTIEWGEFKLDFDKCVRLSRQALIEEERQMDALNSDLNSFDEFQGMKVG